MEKIDDFALSRIGFPVMMPDAGLLLAKFIYENMDLSSGVTLLFGRGPNGGAGLFAISYLREK